MTDACAAVRDRLPELVTGEPAGSGDEAVRSHLADCDDCRELAELMGSIGDSTAAVRDALEPPPGLLERLTRSPCERWLGLLFEAADRELPDSGLERLVDHLDACPSCHRAWDDLTLIHQVGEALTPRPHLAAACVSVRRRRRRVRPAIGRRFAAAAAYVLAVLTSFALGNPVTTARMQKVDTVQRVAATVTAEVGEVASDGRGELKVMLWRTLRWAEERAEDLRRLVGADGPAESPDDEFIELRQGEATS